MVKEFRTHKKAGGVWWIDYETGKFGVIVRPTPLAGWSDNDTDNWDRYDGVFTPGTMDTSFGPLPPQVTVFEFKDKHYFTKPPLNGGLRRVRSANNPHTYVKGSPEDEPDPRN